MMKLVGRISVSLNVESFAEAGDHERNLERLLALIRDSYPDATLDFHQRRERTKLDLAPANKPVVRLNAYGSRRG